MEITALSVKDAEAFLESHARHYKASFEAICAIGVSEGDILHGAAILGRTAEGDGALAHIYVDGASQGYSLLYGACWRTLKSLGYKRTVL